MLAGHFLAWLVRVKLPVEAVLRLWSELSTAVPTGIVFLLEASRYQSSLVSLDMLHGKL
jgi:hypothetical protein